MGDPQGPLRRVGLPLTNRHSPGGSWHGGSVPLPDASTCSNRPTTMLQSRRPRGKASHRFLTIRAPTIVRVRAIKAFGLATTSRRLSADCRLHFGILWLWLKALRINPDAG